MPARGPSLVAWVAWVALGACASAPANLPEARGVESSVRRAVGLPAVDFAPGLAKLLPRGADRCVVARPALLSGAQRALFAPVSQAEALAWLPGVEVLAYASAERTGERGPGARVTYLRVEGERGAIRRALERGSGMSVRWGDFDCGAEGCRRVRAAFVAEGLLRIERGRFGTPSRAGAERRCRTLLKRRTDAVEVEASRSRSLPRSGLSLPLRGSTVTLAGARGIRILREDLMPSREEAALLGGESVHGRDLLAPLRVQGIVPRTEVQDSFVRRTLALPWEDLALRRDDRERMREAERQADALEHLQPAGDVDLRDRAALMAQVGYRLDSMRHRTDEQVNLRREIRSMLEGGLAHAPDDEGLALMLVELLLSSSEDAAEAAARVERFAEEAGRDARWLVYRRHIAALGGTRKLAAALVRDRLVGKRDARRAAEAIIARLATVASYSTAERQVLSTLAAPSKPAIRGRAAPE